MDIRQPFSLIRNINVNIIWIWIEYEWNIYGICNLYFLVSLYICFLVTTNLLLQMNIFINEDEYEYEYEYDYDYHTNEKYTKGRTIVQLFLVDKQSFVAKRPLCLSLLILFCHPTTIFHFTISIKYKIKHIQNRHCKK